MAVTGRINRGNTFGLNGRSETVTYRRRSLKLLRDDAVEKRVVVPSSDPCDGVNDVPGPARRHVLEAGRGTSETERNEQLDDPRLRRPGRRKARICHLIEGSTAQATEPLAIQLMHHLRSGYRFSLVYLTESRVRPAELGEIGFPVHVIVARPGRTWESSRRLAQLLERKKIDLVHAHQSRALPCALIARVFYRRPTILLSEHLRRYPDCVSPKRVVVNRLFLEPRDRIVASSHSVRESLILNDGLPPTQVEVIYDGVHLPPRKWSEEDCSALRRDIGVHPDALLVLQSARFEIGQNHTLAIQAFEQVVRALPRAVLVLAGEGPDRRIVEETVRQRGLGAHVVFLEDRGDPDLLLASVDLLLVTASRDGTLADLTRALAAGKPVVATRVGGVAEVVEDRTCGLITAPGDYAGLAESIHRLGASPDLCQQFGRRARERAEALFSHATTRERYAKVYHDMFAG
jgi:L-malate glycosyltransferase